jgi:hypothetical protein
VRLRSNRTKTEDLLARLHWSILVARPLNTWPNPKLKVFHCRLSFRFRSAEIATNELVNVVMYRQFLFFKSLPVIVKFISAVILCNALDLYLFL